MHPMWIMGYMMIGYVGTTIMFSLKKDWPMFIVWTGYSFANIGFIWQALK